MARDTSTVYEPGERKRLKMLTAKGRTTTATESEMDSWFRGNDTVLTRHFIEGAREHIRSRIQETS